LTPYLTAVLFSLVVFNLGSIGLKQFDEPPVELTLTPLENSVISSLPTEEMLDIYYIVLDGYSREDVLREVYGFDNSQFIDYLRRNDFFVASESRSNYLHTVLSIPSTLNMVYLDEFAEAAPNPNETRLYQNLVRDNKVARLLHSSGYRIFHLSNEIGFKVASASNFEVEVKYPLLGEYPLGQFGRTVLEPIVGNEFGYFLVHNTLLGHMTFNRVGQVKVPILGDYTDQWNRTFTASRTVEMIELLKSVPDIEGPKFIYAHFRPPHPPYVFDRNGNVPKGTHRFRSWAEKELYIDQLVWINKSIEDAIGHILEKAKDNSIIILQADHGSSSADPELLLKYGGDPSAVLIKEKSSILNAYYLPKSCGTSNLYPSITSVNTFRIVFDSCFGTDFGLLEDKTYWSDSDHLYDIVPIENLINYRDDS